MKKFLAFSVICLFLFSCNKPGGTDPGGSGNGGSGNGGSGNTSCSGPAKSFAADVNPIIQGSCATNASCHGAGSNIGPGSLLTYTQIFNVRSTIRSEVAGGHMPPGGPLSATQKNSIICWIDNGAPNN